MTASSAESEAISESTTSIETDSLYRADWSDITVDGLDEDSFIQKFDTEVLQDAAEKLQSLVEEEIAEEKENPEIILSEGFTRVFQKDLYHEVIAMGDYYDWASGKEYLELFTKYMIDNQSK